MTDWVQVANPAGEAAARVIGGAWDRVEAPAMAQIQTMSAAVAQMEIDYAAGQLTLDEYESLRDVQKDALNAVLSGYEAIAVLTAEQAVDAAWSVFELALQAAIHFP